MELLEEVVVPPMRAEFEAATAEPEFEDEEAFEDEEESEDEEADLAEEDSEASFREGAAEEWEAASSLEFVGESIESGEAGLISGGARGTLIKFPRHGYGSVVPLSSIKSQLELEEETSGGQSGLEVFEIFPPDERQLVADTSPIPFRFICALDLVFPNPGTPGTAVLLRGSGTLISNRHVLTAGHNVFDDLQRVGIGGGPTQATAILAAPGRHDRRLPFGRSRATQMRAPTQWTTSRDAQFDFALLTLADSLGSRTHRSLGGRQLGFWGHPELGGGTRLRPLEDRLLAQGPGQCVGLSDRQMPHPASWTGGDRGRDGRMRAHGSRYDPMALTWSDHPSGAGGDASEYRIRPRHRRGTLRWTRMASMAGIPKHGRGQHRRPTSGCRAVQHHCQHGNAHHRGRPHAASDVDDR